MNFYLTSCRLFMVEEHWGTTLGVEVCCQPIALKKCLNAPFSHFNLKRIATFIKRNSFKPDNASSWTFSIGTTGERNKKKNRDEPRFIWRFFMSCMYILINDFTSASQGVWSLNCTLCCDVVVSFTAAHSVERSFLSTLTNRHSETDYSSSLCTVSL